MKRLKELMVLAVILLFVPGFSGCYMYSAGRASGEGPYENPEWAPPYYNGERYLYLPDIETYYDLSSHEFVFLYNGQWRFSPDIPPGYDEFDLNSCFAIVIDSNVFQPWMHHQYYLSHYPRYYYRDYYDRSNFPYVRGFDENNKHAIYWQENERSKARSWNNENVENNRQFKYTKEDLQQQKNINNQGYSQPQIQNNRTTQSPGNVNMTNPQPGKAKEISKTHDTHYYGKTVGTPVKVQKQMRNQATPQTTGSGNNNKNKKNDQNSPGRR